MTSSSLPILAFVFDFDGTVAPEQGVLRSRAMASVWRDFAASGVENVMLTGRSLPWAIGNEGVSKPEDIRALSKVIGEYGGAIWDQATDTTTTLAPLVGPEFPAALRRYGIPSRAIRIGLCSVVVHRPHFKRALDAFTDLNSSRTAAGLSPVALHGLAQNSLTYLPHGVSKANSLQKVVIEGMGIDPRQIVGAGNSWADADFLRRCAYALVPENADPELLLLPNVIVGRGRDATGILDAIRQLRARGVVFGTDARGLAA